ncbi:MAG: UvrD-helicase domain-containing protein, partial [Legionellales bacterium]|nr:UvrD-helicase domain-containing protein [Legionellales bacterium]
MIVDHLERKQALKTTGSYIIQAPAGSGKTEILIQRILSLLTTVSKPEEILALTFTRKAAAEMRARILNALKMDADTLTNDHQKTTFDLAKKVSKKSDELNWELLLNPSRLQIMTIDSFAASLVNQMPLLSQIGAKHTILENPTQEYVQAAQNTIKFLESESSWKNVLFGITSYFDNQFSVMEKLFVNMLSKREQWLPHITKTDNQDEIRKSFNNCLREINYHNSKNIYDLFASCDKSELIELGNFSLKYSNKNIENSLEDIQTPPSFHKNNIDSWKFFAKFLLTKNLTIRKKVTLKEGFPSQSQAKTPEEKQIFKSMKERMVKFLAELGDNPAISSALQEVLLSPPSSYSNKQWDITINIFQALKLLVANLMIIFKEKNALDFAELNIRSLNTLEIDGIPTDLSLFLDYKIKHILIDEFQDTSNHHFNLIKRLTAEWLPNENKTIFIVGDPMQSIYRFREAEVGLFLQVKNKGINNIKLKPLQLKSNFRSNKTIVDFCNSVFAKSFPEKNDISRGAIAFSSSESTQKNDKNSNVNIYPCVSEENEALITIKQINIYLKKYPNKKIAILARTRKNLKSIIHQLQKKNIKFIAHEIDNLYTKSITHDLLAITRAIYDVTDNLAWLAILRAPWCGLKLEDLLKISQASRNSSIPNTITEQLPILSKSGTHRLKQLKPVFAYIIRNSGRENLSKLVTTVWQLLGGPDALQSFKDLQWVKQFIELLEKTQQKNSFFDIHYFKEQLINSHITPHHESEPNIELMTIHKSKGLEFDIVFILGTSSIIPNPQRNILEWSELPFNNDTSLLLAPIKGIGHDQNLLYEYLYRTSKEKDEHEKIRLMYVAATRAK